MVSNNSPQTAPRPASRIPEKIPQRPLPASVVGLSNAAYKLENRGLVPGGTLMVGKGIQIKGEIESCTKLVVEGRVEASMMAHNLEIPSDGLFQGKAEVDSAEISGRFDGILTVREHLTIHNTGKVTGTIRYAKVTIEAGGQLSGDVQVLAAKRVQAAE